MVPQMPRMRTTRTVRQERLDHRRIRNERLLAMTDGHCWYCGCEITDRTMTRDHVLPRAMGGTTDDANLVPACTTCNTDKGCKTLDEYRRESRPGEQFYGEAISSEHAPSNTEEER